MEILMNITPYLAALIWIIYRWLLYRQETLIRLRLIDLVAHNKPIDGLIPLISPPKTLPGFLWRALPDLALASLISPNLLAAIGHISRSLTTGG